MQKFLLNNCGYHQLLKSPNDSTKSGGLGSFPRAVGLLYGRASRAGCFSGLRTSLRNLWSGFCSPCLFGGPSQLQIHWPLEPEFSSKGVCPGLLSNHLPGCVVLSQAACGLVCLFLTRRKTMSSGSFPGQYTNSFHLPYN